MTNDYDKLRAQIAYAREAWLDDDISGETVHALCDALAALLDERDKAELHAAKWIDVPGEAGWRNYERWRTVIELFERAARAWRG